jgi:hypothetical protein
MKTSSRALIIFGIVLTALIVVTVVLVLTLGQKNPPQLAENTPQGTLQRYLQAIQDKDYQTAYKYLIPTSIKNPDNSSLTYEQWLNTSRNFGDTTWKAYLGQVNTTGDTASINLNVDVFQVNGLLSNPVNSHTVTFVLKQSNGQWRILSPTDLFWIY